MTPRVADSAAGAYSGVAVVAKVPTRALCAAWPDDLYDTGRVQIVGSLVHNVWITGAIMYGYPQGKSITMLWIAPLPCWSSLLIT